ncbi:MAG: GNAT family N-acetyltransferase [Chitinophagaceae bacterium]
MIFREATIADITQMQVVRHSVKENVLSDPSLVTDKDCEDYITNRGKGWVCEVEGKIVGFAIADLKDHNIWALFVDPLFEKKGIGRRLHQLMLDRYFDTTKETVGLSTAPNSRAAHFYKIAGWQQVGFTKRGDLLFEMTYSNWRLHQ